MTRRSTPGGSTSPGVTVDLADARRRRQQRQQYTDSLARDLETAVKRLLAVSNDRRLEHPSMGGIAGQLRIIANDVADTAKRLYDV